MSAPPSTHTWRLLSGPWSGRAQSADTGLPGHSRACLRPAPFPPCPPRGLAAHTQPPTRSSDQLHSADREDGQDGPEPCRPPATQSSPQRCQWLPWCWERRPEPWGARPHPAPLPGAPLSSHGDAHALQAQARCHLLPEAPLASCPSTTSVLGTCAPGRQLLSPAGPVHPQVPAGVRPFSHPPRGPVPAWAAPQEAQEPGQAVTGTPTPICSSQEGVDGGGTQGLRVHPPLAAQGSPQGTSRRGPPDAHSPLPSPAPERPSPGPLRPRPGPTGGVGRRCRGTNRELSWEMAASALPLADTPRARAPSSENSWGRHGLWDENPSSTDPMPSLPHLRSWACHRRT